MRQYCLKMGWQKLVRRWDTRKWHKYEILPSIGLPLLYFATVVYFWAASPSTPLMPLRLLHNATHTIFVSRRLIATRGSAIAEEPRDALRQLKYYGRFLTELLTRSSANSEEPCEHTVSWNRVNRCTNVRRIACENVCNRWMTFKAIQGLCRCHHLIGHILFHISLPL